MSLSIVTGRANSGKTGVAHDVVRDAITRGEPAVLLLPSAPDVARAADELSRSHPVGVRCAAFGEYLSSVWLHRGDGRGEVTVAQRRLLLIDAASDAAVSSRGLARLAGRIVRDLAEQTGEAWRAQPTVVRGHGADLARVIGAYGRRLTELGLVEPGEIAHILSLDEQLPDRVIVAHRFTDFTPSQEAFITGVAASGCEVTVTLNWQDGFAPTEALSDLVGRLVAAGGHVRAIDAQETYGTADELLAIENGLFVKPVALQPNGAVRLSLAEGPEAEALGIAAEVSRLIEEESVSPEQIAILFRSPGAHAGYLREALRDCGISADFDVERAFLETPFGRAVLGLLGFALNGDRAALLSFLRTRFSGASQDDLAALEAQWRRSDVRGREALARDVRRLGDASRAAIDIAQECSTAGVTPDNAPQWASLMRGMFVTGFGRSGSVLPEEAAFDAIALAAVIALLEDIAALGRPVVPASELVEALTERQLSTRTVERPGHVQVTGVARARARRFDAVIVGGLNAEEFPARPTEDALPGSAVAEVVEAFGASAGARLGDPYERLLFYQTITRPRRFLVLSACSTDAAGEVLQVSPLLEEVLDFYRSEDGRLTLPQSRRALAQVPGEDDAALERDVLRADAFAGRLGDPRVRAAKERALRRTPGDLGEEMCCELREREVFSASEIESYLACPYRWFFERALRPEVLDRESAALDEGSFAHDLLAQFYEHAEELVGSRRLTPELIPDALDALGELHSKQVASLGAGSVFEELSWRDVLRWSRRILEDDARMLPGFEPTLLEWDFTAQPVDMGEYRLSGRVDRVDVRSGGDAVVVDYKRSGATSAAEILDRGKVQLPLYMKAVEDLTGDRVVGGLYRSLRQRKNRGALVADSVGGPYLVRTDLMSAEDFAALREQGLTQATEAVRNIRAGRIPATPRNKDACTYCPAVMVCRGVV